MLHREVFLGTQFPYGTYDATIKRQLSKTSQLLKIVCIETLMLLLFLGIKKKENLMKIFKLNYPELIDTHEKFTKLYLPTLWH